MKIAIIGGGFTGLAIGWYLLERASDVILDLWDHRGIGGGASGVAAGLLHPYAGLHSKLNRYGSEGLKETEILLNIASKALKKNVFQKTSLLRIAATSTMTSDYLKAFNQYSDIDWLPSVKPFFNDISYPGILIHQAYTVDCPLYLQGLWQACKEKGAHLIEGFFSPHSHFSSYDLVIFATGAYNLFPEVHVNQIKGQVLEIEDPKISLPCPINCQAYLLKNLFNPYLIAGATFEKTFTDDQPNIEIAKKEIFPKIRGIIPSIDQAKIVDCRAGLRASTQGHLPLIQQLSAKSWTLTGMGSKGLLYHALYAKQLVERILPRL